MPVIEEVADVETTEAAGTEEAADVETTEAAAPNVSAITVAKILFFIIFSSICAFAHALCSAKLFSGIRL